MQSKSSEKVYPKGFRSRRAQNWLTIGFLYASFYMCRYNFRFAVPGLQEEFGFDIQDVSFIFAIWSVAYGTGQLINGLFSDVIGGRKSMLIGACGTLVINLIFGFSSLVSHFFAFALLSLLNGYFQSYGAPGMIKINAAWFRRTERGSFAGIFGGMIQLGQVSISRMAPALLNGGLVVGTIVLANAGEWRSVFRFPPLFTMAAAFLFYFVVKPSPEDAGYPGVIVDEVDNSEGVKVSLRHSLKTILFHPLIWFYASAYACTGGVRHSLDQLAILYFRDQLGFDMQSNIPLVASVTLMAMPFVAFLGSLGSGVISDKFADGERGPVAVVLYFIEGLTIAAAAVLLLNDFVGPDTSGVFVGCMILIMISLTVNSTHSLVGAAAPMDIGGKKMAGFASGVIDSFQYYGGAISFLITGQVLSMTQETHGYLFWYIIMSGFGFLGGTIMLLMLRKKRRLNL